MKSSAQIQGLPIFSLVDGAEIGQVKQLVIEPSSGSVRLFQVENDQHAIGVHVLPYASVIGVGDFAVTVESGESIRDLNNVLGARDLVLLSYKIIGTRVLSRKGQLMGTVHEYYVDEETGSVTACSFAEHGQSDSIRVFHRDNIMTFGRDVLVIKDETSIYATLDEGTSTSENVIPHPATQEATRAEQEIAVTTVTDSTSPQATSTGADTADTTSDATETTSDTTDSADNVLDSNASASSENVTQLNAADSSDNVTNLKAPTGPYAYLIGKVLTADLTADNGDVIATRGTVVTEELIERVKAVGPTLFMKLNRLT
ncbi:hypothetical protein [Tumebacillus permanentifrigoris]|uniref:Uncharacterized protein YrrD n=1 Tax=Tumebacillus permanentifrigoris TaxID=378543 RepID=A0A316DAU6_9BACL|nr:hypothetical protein [Tumebacillus permanentifrigoris]PWK10282.1 uncharacterized protein YrrD [Tumebacillus permanentifrigoris]